MTDKNITTERVEVVRSIGAHEAAAERGVASVANAVREAHGDTFAKRADAVAAVLAWIGIDAADAPAQRGPKGEDGKRPATNFGRGLDSVVRNLMRGSDAPTAVVLRASLSGEGGGSVTIPTDHALYSQIVALIKGE